MATLAIPDSIFFNASATEVTGPTEVPLSRADDRLLLYKPQPNFDRRL